MLGPDGKTFTNSSRMERQESGRVSSELDILVQSVAKLARYGVYFQIYRSHIDIFGDDWNISTLTQCHLKPLLSMQPTDISPPHLPPPPPSPADSALGEGIHQRERRSKVDCPNCDSSLRVVEALESDGLIQLISNLAGSSITKGAYICPMFAHKEVLMGIMVVQDIDDMPHALYDRNKLLGGERDLAWSGGGLSSNNIPVDGRQRSRDRQSQLPTNSALKHQDESQCSQVKGPEDGFLLSVRQSALVLSSSLLSARCRELIGTNHYTKSDSFNSVYIASNTSSLLLSILLLSYRYVSSLIMNLNLFNSKRIRCASGVSTNP